jgi:hypothetical protein
MLSHHDLRFFTGFVKKYEDADDEAQGYVPVCGWFQSTSGMRYDCVAWQQSSPNAREEAM